MVIANPESELDELYQAKKKYNFIDLKIKALPWDELYDYLYASDVLLIHRCKYQMKSTPYFTRKVHHFI